MEKYLCGHTCWGLKDTKYCRTQMQALNQWWTQHACNSLGRGWAQPGAQLKLMLFLVSISRSHHMNIPSVCPELSTSNVFSDRLSKSSEEQPLKSNLSNEKHVSNRLLQSVWNFHEKSRVHKYMYYFYYLQNHTYVGTLEKQNKYCDFFVLLETFLKSFFFSLCVKILFYFKLTFMILKHLMNTVFLGKNREWFMLRYMDICTAYTIYE
jgi:hypothetical protein